MFTYTNIEEACKRQGINPNKKGNNIYSTAISVYAKDKPANLKKLGFPEAERVQIEKIGTIINNLISQMKFPLVFETVTQKGKNEKEMHDKIQKFLPTARASLIEWFKLGANKAKKDVSDFTLGNGIVYQIDPKKVKAMEEMNKTGLRYTTLSKKRYYEKLR